jgi:hypothetical protein
MVPFLAALAVAGLAGILNPLGWTNLFTAALPAAAASFGLTQLDHFVGRPQIEVRDTLGKINRSWSWIVIATMVAIAFVAVLGPGVH